MRKRNDMLSGISSHENPFILKRAGKFDKALILYAQEYVNARHEENAYIEEICFDQMVDIKLLEFLKGVLNEERQPFKNRMQLRNEVSKQLEEFLYTKEASGGQEQFQKHFNKSWGEISQKIELTIPFQCGV